LRLTQRVDKTKPQHATSQPAASWCVLSPYATVW